MITEKERRLWAHMSEVYDQLMIYMQPYNDKYEFIHKYETSDHPLAVEYRELVKERNALNELNRPQFVWEPGVGHVPISESGVKKTTCHCGVKITGTHHMEGPDPECMRCYCSRIITTITQ